jgi:hypothetical protein
VVISSNEVVVRRAATLLSVAPVVAADSPSFLASNDAGVTIGGAGATI